MRAWLSSLLTSVREYTLEADRMPSQEFHDV